MPNPAAEIWTKPLCSTCQEEKTLLRCDGYAVQETVIKGKTNEEMADMDRDAFAQLQMQDGYFPVVRIDGRFYIPAAVKEVIL